MPAARSSDCAPRAGGTTLDPFLDGRLLIEQPATGFRAATDPVLLAASAPVRPGHTVLELGCGVGVASLCLGHRMRDVRLTGLELQTGYAGLARRNAERNAIALEVVEGDVADMPATLRARAFDVVLLNPPWFPEKQSPSPDAGRDLARRGDTLAGWIDVALVRTRPGGHVIVIQLTERLDEILAALHGRAGDITILPLAAREGRDAKRVIVRARKGSRGPTRLVSPLVLHAGASHDLDRDDFTPRAASVLRGGARLDF